MWGITKPPALVAQMGLTSAGCPTLFNINGQGPSRPHVGLS